jgi:hypothetical protein
MNVSFAQQISGSILTAFGGKLKGDRTYAIFFDQKERP